MYISTSVEEAFKLVQTIPHKSCVSAIDRHWRVDHDGRVQAQSVLWLFCWAKTGMGSEAARLRSIEVFNKILPTSFEELDSVVDHAYARKARYLGGDLEESFAQEITKRPQ